MLDGLRRNANSWMIQFLLLLVVVSFIVYFGVSSPDESGNPHPPARVNGVPIAAVEVNNLVAAELDGNPQLQMLKAINKGTIPPEQMRAVRRNVTNSLINQELLRQELKRSGLNVSKKQLFELIKDNSEFQTDGVFDPQRYRDFLAEYGLESEKRLMENLLVQRFFEPVGKLGEPSQAEVEKILQPAGMKRQFAVVKIRKEAPTKPEAADGKDGDGGNDVDDKAKKDAPAEVFGEGAAKEVWAQWKKHPAGIDATLKTRGLKLTQTRELKGSDLDKVFGGQATPERQKSLLALTTESPFPSDYYDEGEFYYLVKLSKVIDPTQPDKDSKDKGQDPIARLKDDTQGAFQEALLASVILKLRLHANIEYQDE